MRWSEEAQAFWLREPGAGEIRPDPLAAAGTRRRDRPHASLRGQPGHRVAGLRRARAAEPVRRDAGALPGGRLPRPGEVRLPQRGVVEDGPPALLRTHRLLPAPAPDGVRRPCFRGDGRAATSVPVGARRPRRARRDGGQRAVGRRATGRRPGGGRRRRAARAAAWPGCSLGSPGSRSRWSTSTRRRAAVAAALGRRTSRCPSDAPAAATSWCTPARPRRACSGPWSCSRPEGTVVELSWYGDAETDALARRQLPLRPAHRPGQPGGHGGGRPARAPDDGRPAARSRSTCCATRRSTRC